jgi:hypothetical protein
METDDDRRSRSTLWLAAADMIPPPVKVLPPEPLPSDKRT